MTTPPAPADRAKRHMTDSASPRFAFLLCSERSGSNLITSILNGHRSISGPPPSHMFRLFAQNCHAYWPLTDDDRWEALVEDVLAAHGAMLGSWNTSPSRESLIAAAPERRMADLLDHVYTLEANGAEWVFVKENYTYRILPFLLANWPTAWFVHQVRDPRDVAASWHATDSHPGGVARAVDQWMTDQVASMAAFGQLRTAGRALQIRYEDLVATPEVMTERICSSFGLPFDEGMLAFHDDPRTRRNAESIDAWANLARPVMRDNVGKFERMLSEDDIRYVELATRDVMPPLGYEAVTDVEDMSDEAVQDELASLSDRLSVADPVRIPSDEEAERRQRRQEVIDRVVSRAAAR